MRSKSAFAIAVLALSGCALIKQGTTQRVKFESDPPKAEVWLNGEKHPDLTPTTIELPRKEVAYQIKKQGYDTIANKLTTRTSSYFYWSFLGGVITTLLDWITGSWQEFDLPEEDKDTVRVVLEPSIDSSEHIVAISSNPAGASITVDTLALQEVTGIKSKPTRINVKWKGPNDQERTIILRFAGYEPEKLRLRRGEKKLHSDLRPSPINQQVVFDSEPRDADVWVDGAFAGKTPVVKSYEWRKGDDREKKVEFRKEGYHSKSEVIKDKVDKTIAVKLVEKFETVAVRIDTAPSGSIVEVDGKPAGATPADIQLTWSVTLRSHKLKVSRPGYASEELVVDYEKKTEPVIVRLKPALPDFP